MPLHGIDRAPPLPLACAGQAGTPVVCSRAMEFLGAWVAENPGYALLAALALPF